MARLSVFISYRRNDSRYLVREIAAGLRERFGKDNVFLDRDTIRIGEEFPSRIDEAIKKSDVMLVVIGENFLPALTSSSDSWIRQELLSARKHKRLVFPVLHPGRVMPTKAELPDDVEWLSDLNAFALGDEEHLETDIERLSSDLAKQFNQSLRRARRRRHRAPLAAGAVATLAVALGTVALIRSGSDPAPIIEVQSPSVTSPGNIVDCSDFDSYDDAKRWFDKYYDQFGDVAELDVDGDLEPCESLRTVAATDTAEVSSPASISAAEPPSTDLESPGNIVDCSDFVSYDDAKQWFDKYYDDFGDVAELDFDGDLEPCESLRVDEADGETPADDKVDGSTNQLLDEQSSAPDNPGNSVNCDDFDSYSEAKEWFNTYFPYFGDVAYLDSNGDGRPCDTFFVSAHDMFADAKRINATGSGTTTAENINASTESGEPNHTAGSYRSIWFALTAPGTGQLEIDTSGSTFDTTLTVYQGSTLRTLNRITGNDDYDGSRSRVAISTTNETYMVAVDGYEGSTGNIQLNWSYTPSPSTTVLTARPSTESDSNVRITSDEFPNNPLSASRSLAVIWAVTLNDPNGQLPTNVLGSLCPPDSRDPLAPGCVRSPMSYPSENNGFSRTYEGFFTFSEPPETGEWVPFVSWPFGDQPPEVFLVADSRLMVIP